MQSVNRIVLTYAAIATVACGALAADAGRQRMHVAALQQRIALIDARGRALAPLNPALATDVARREANVRRAARYADDFTYEIGRLSGAIPAPPAGGRLVEQPAAARQAQP